MTDLLHDLDIIHTNYLNTAKQQKITPTSAQSEFSNLAPRFWVLSLYFLSLAFAYYLFVEFSDHAHFKVSAAGPRTEVYQAASATHVRICSQILLHKLIYF